MESLVGHRSLEKKEYMEFDRPSFDGEERIYGEFGWPSFAGEERIYMYVKIVCPSFAGEERV